MSTKRNKKISKKTRKMRGGINRIRKMFGKSSKEPNMEIMTPLNQNVSSETINPLTENVSSETGKITDKLEVGSIVKYVDENQIKQIGIIGQLIKETVHINGKVYLHDKIQLYTKSELLRVANKIIDMSLSKEDSKLVSKIKQLFEKT